MKYARIVGGMAVDVRADSPSGYFTPDIAAQFVEVPDEVEDNWILSNEEWRAPDVVEYAPPEPRIPTLSPVEFKLLFSVQERIAIAAAKATDPILDDLFSILDDPRLKVVDLNLSSNKEMLDYLQSQELITAERKAEIMTGILK